MPPCSASACVLRGLQYQTWMLTSVVNSSNYCAAFGQTSRRRTSSCESAGRLAHICSGSRQIRCRDPDHQFVVGPHLAQIAASMGHAYAVEELQNLYRPSAASANGIAILSGGESLAANLPRQSGGTGGQRGDLLAKQEARIGDAPSLAVGAPAIQQCLYDDFAGEQLACQFTCGKWLCAAPFGLAQQLLPERVLGGAKTGGESRQLDQ